ncbi:MAG TPA: hypothetical protein DEG92_07105 [Rikenellaceae bacterium]|nr:hypothetical protein [Rikenellaceae bacterium]
MKKYENQFISKFNKNYGIPKKEAKMPTKIEWTDESWNPITGCTPISPGCLNCYAKKMTNRLKGRYGYHHENPFQVTMHKDKFSFPLSLRRPRKVFICSMGDIFHKDVPDAWIDAVLHVTSIVPRHTYIILTKRPERMQYYINAIVDKHAIEIPSNLWFGVTTENQEMADFRLPLLIDTKIANKFVSIEPMLGPVDLSNYIDCLNWVIVGGETGNKARDMKAEWAMKVKFQCLQKGIPFFFKQMSNKAPTPPDLAIKQFPSGMPV